MKIVAIADLHGKLEDLEKIKKQLEEADLVIEVGDLTNFHPEDEARAMLEQLLDFNENLLIVPGNCDQPETIGLYDGARINLHGKGKALGSVGFFGVGGSNITPFGTPIELEERELLELLREGYGEVEETKAKIMVSHAPPKDTKADGLPSGAHVGSSAVREFVEKHDVDLLLCAHIHEARGSDRIGKTEIVNVGPLHRGYVTVDIDDDTGKLSCALVDLS